MAHGSWLMARMARMVACSQAEEKFRALMTIPDTHEVHFFNGGATLQFAAIPMNLLGKPVSGALAPSANCVLA